MGVGAYTLRPLTPADEPHFQTFAGSGEVQSLIRDELALALTMHTEAVGAWDGDTLIAISAWRKYGDEWASTIISVDWRYRRQGIAEQLKRDLIVRARTGGATWLRSTVSGDNESMLRLNQKVGAKLVRLPSYRNEPLYFHALVRLR